MNNKVLKVNGREKEEIDHVLLDIYAKEGIVSKDIGDGSWGWTVQGQKDLPYNIRVILSGLLYGDEWQMIQARRYQLELNAFGYAYDGYPLEG